MKNLDEIFSLTDAQEQPKRGAMLIAKPSLSDACFSRSVIVVADHSQESSMGLIVNNPSGMLLNDIIPNLNIDEDIPVYLGGPVGCDRLFYIHTLGDTIAGARPLCEGLYIGGNYDSMKRYLQSGAPVYGKIKFIVGYSGWSEGQLNSELAAHNWAVNNTPSIEMAMRDGADDIWHQAIDALGKRYHIWNNWPYDPSMN